MASESARRDRDGKAPRSVEQITKAGQDYEYSASIGARYWLRTASGTVERGGTPRCCSFLRLTQSLQAKVYEYEDEDNDEQTYFLLFRHAHLILTQLAQHPNVKSPPAKEIFSKAQREVNRDLKKLNILKPRINKRYERYVRLVREREAKRAATRQDTTVAPGQKASHELNWDLNGDINFGDMKTEILPCGSLRRNSKDERSHAEKHADAGQSLAGDDLSWRFQQVRRRVDTFHQKPQSMLSDKPPDSTVPAQYNYPTVRTHHAVYPPSRSDLEELDSLDRRAIADARLLYQRNQQAFTSNRPRHYQIRLPTNQPPLIRYKAKLPTPFSQQHILRMVPLSGNCSYRQRFALPFSG